MAQAILKLKNNKELHRFIRFGLVGLSGTLVDFGLLVIGKELFGLPTVLANILAYSGGIANNYTLNRLWTFSDARRKSAWMQFIQFTLVSTGGLILNTLLVLFFERLAITYLGLADTGYLLAKIAATGIVFIWNFILNRLWTFNDVE